MNTAFPCPLASSAAAPQFRPSFLPDHRRFWLGLLAALLMGFGTIASRPVWAGPVPWTDAPYSYFAKNAKLETVLAEFAGSFSLSLNMAPSLSGLVNGRFTTQNPTEFITKLAGVYGFVWYTHAGTLHVSKSSDTLTRSLPAPGGGIANLRQALTDLGVLEPRFGWGELAEQKVVLVSGPPTYVNLIESTLSGLPLASNQQQVLVVRLKHASAEDRVILYRDREITTPGLARVLRELVASSGAVSLGGGNNNNNNNNNNSNNGSSSSGTGMTNEAVSSIAAPLRSAPGSASDSTGTLASAASGVNSNNSFNGNRATQGNNSSSGNRNNSNSNSNSRGPSIQSDTRLNAIIIQDIPERLPVYEKLIAQLDVPTPLIEIEAMIIDINTERARELGIRWSGRDGRTAFGFGALTQQPEAGTLSIVRGPEGANVTSGSLMVNAGNYLVNQIRLLENNGDASIQSRPSVLTTDNIGALLDLSETFYVRLQGERVATVTPVTAGTTLRVTPRLIGGVDGPMVQLIVDIEDGQIQDRRIDNLPTVRRSAVSTQAIVQQNETLVIAGYTSDQNLQNDERVPVLGEIPVLGLLFSNKTRTVQKRERWFLIKPRVISLPGMAPMAGVPQATTAATAAATLAAPVVPMPVLRYEEARAAAIGPPLAVTPLPVPDSPRP
jgi:type III secretion protein C